MKQLIYKVKIITKIKNRRKKQILGIIKMSGKVSSFPKRTRKKEKKLSRISKKKNKRISSTNLKRMSTKPNLKQV